MPRINGVHSVKELEDMLKKVYDLLHDILENYIALYIIAQGGKDGTDN